MNLVRGEEKEPGIHSLCICLIATKFHGSMQRSCFDDIDVTIVVCNGYLCVTLQWLLVCHSSSVQLLMASSALDAKR